MKPRKELWRFRKRSGGDPIRVLECGCKQWVYDGTIVRYCKQHEPKVKKDGEK